MVEKVADPERPAYGDMETVRLPSDDDAKRAADAQPDFEETRVDPPADLSPSKLPDVPLLVVEKTDDEPAYGDDFGQDATPAQKVAHDMRTADASPDKVIVSPDTTDSDTVNLEETPLFLHESLDTHPHPPVASIDTIEEESLDSSNDLTSSGDTMHTPPESDEVQSRDESEQEALLTPPRSSSDVANGTSSQIPLLPHERVPEAEQTTSTTDVAPGFSYESGSQDNQEPGSDEDDEFDKAPLLSHETGFSNVKGSEDTTTSGYSTNDKNMEPQHYGPYDDDDSLDGDADETPLLPHERASGSAGKVGSEHSANDDPFSLDTQPTFGYENDSIRGTSRRVPRPGFMRTRTNSSSLPHKLPRSDAEDENLNDPSLEQFPVDREQILERVATIGTQLSEDETFEDQLHSPQLSVFSQACSSVDLVPVKSYTSLASVPEADDSDAEEEDEHDDLDSLPSPVFISDTADRALSAYGLARGSQATKEERKPEHAGDQSKDVPATPRTERDAASFSSEALNPITPPLTPDQKSSKEAVAVSSVDWQLRERQKADEDTQETTRSQDDSSSKDKETTPTPGQQLDQRDAKSPQNLMSTLLGSVGSFLSSCTSDPKRAR